MPENPAHFMTQESKENVALLRLVMIMSLAIFDDICEIPIELVLVSNTLSGFDLFLLTYR